MLSSNDSRRDSNRWKQIYYANFVIGAGDFKSRFRANQILVGGFNERLIALEERVSDIEGKSRG
jgi:hypothetical protein